MKQYRRDIDADLLALKLRRENLVPQHKAFMEEQIVRQRIKMAEKIRNYQNEYGTLKEALARMHFPGGRICGG